MSNITNILTHYFKEINNSLIAKGQSFDLKEISKNLVYSGESAEGNEGKLAVLLTELCEVFLGIRPENTKINVFKYASQRLTGSFEGITLQDVESAFKTFKKGEKTYYSLTVEDIYYVVFGYWQKRNQIKHEALIIQEKIDKEAQREIERKAFKRLAIEKYNKALDDDCIILDEFESYTIAPKLAQNLNQRVKNELFEKAKVEHYERLKNDNVFNVVPSVNYIYARLIVLECLNKKLNYENIKSVRLFRGEPI